MTFAVGSLVRARGREWVVLPESSQDPDTLVLRPLGGRDDEITGVYLPLEKVEPATFVLPDPSGELGNHLSSSLLRDAVRLGFRSAAGPFRALGHIAVEPRPYQLVPLMMALRQDPVRLLVADDVGVGKTIEALLVARELLDRGEIARIAVLCPPHLAEQWQEAMRAQFHIDAELVLASTAARLERECGPGESLFDRHANVVVSMDYIKSQRRFDTFVRACPEFVIVDEAHTCTDAGGARSASQQRHALLAALVDGTAPAPAQREQNASRHLVLVTATPHSGNPRNFQSLLALLEPTFRELPEDLRGDANRRHREQLARHVVQRRRGDVQAYLAAEPNERTPFPVREMADHTYELSEPYAAFFKKLVRFCRERVLDDTLQRERQRVRWWSALSMLRSLSSSPAAAAATLRNRARSDSAETVEEIDELGRRTVLDLDEESGDGVDVVHGTQEGDDTDSSDARALRRLATEASALFGKDDHKLQRGIALIDRLVKDGFSPIVFCRFIPTVEYVTEALRKKYKDRVAIEGVTGDLPPEERERRVASLAERPTRVMVCTDCLSEGINLQHAFDAVVHYDLSWNPTRHEQREGRADRFGQPSPKVRATTLYGADNPVDIIVRERLIEKHKAILGQLGVYVPVPQESDRLVEALVKEIFFGAEDPTDAKQLRLAFERKIPAFDEVVLQWDRAVDRERQSRALFAQHAIKVEEVSAEVTAARRALGGEADVERFVLGAVRGFGATVTSRDGAYALDLRECPAALRDAVAGVEKLDVAFHRANGAHGTLLERTHPFVTGVAGLVLETALDPHGRGPARRCGAIRSADVAKRTSLLLVRGRFHLVVVGADGAERPLLAEDVVLAAFEGTPDEPTWLGEAAIEQLLSIQPTANIPADLARTQLSRVLSRFESVAPAVDAIVQQRGDTLLAAHRRVRAAVRPRVRTTRVVAHTPADVLGLYLYLPTNGVL